MIFWKQSLTSVAIDPLKLQLFRRCLANSLSIKLKPKLIRVRRDLIGNRQIKTDWSPTQIKLDQTRVTVQAKRLLAVVYGHLKRLFIAIILRCQFLE